jgi:hypothetical protein
MSKIVAETDVNMIMNMCKDMDWDKDQINLT